MNKPAPHKPSAAERDETALKDAVSTETRRSEKARREAQSALEYTIFTGTIALLFVVPVIGGAYLGRWIDGLAADYSARWTVSLILLGVGIGAYNVYRFLQEHP